MNDKLRLGWIGTGVMVTPWPGICWLPAIR